MWFGAAAPLALLAPTLRRAGARHIVASTHGHEVGWSMLPVARQALGRIGEHTDVGHLRQPLHKGPVRCRIRRARCAGASAAGGGHGCVRPDPAARAELRARYGLGDRPTVLCLSRLVPRKGQDALIVAFAEIRNKIDGAVLMLVGGGPHQDKLRATASAVGVADDVIFTGGVPADELAAHHTIADVFVMPCRTRGAGLDVEGLGIVFLEASASGVPVIADAPAERRRRCWRVRPGMLSMAVPWRPLPMPSSVSLTDPDRAAAMGAADVNGSTSSGAGTSSAPDCGDCSVERSHSGGFDIPCRPGQPDLLDGPISSAA